MARPKEFDVDEALEAAMEAFWERGYEATSLSDLTRAMGVQKASLYATYGDKHQLFVAALERYARLEAEELKSQLSKPNARAAIHGVFSSATACGNVKACRRGCFLVNTMTEVAPHDPVVASVLKRAVDRTERLFAETLERGRAQNEFPADLDVRANARILVSALYGIAVLKKIDPAHPRLVETSDAAARMLEA
jgi:TetR/AcrR family transcriptional repressor of nem operon